MWGGRGGVQLGAIESVGGGDESGSGRMAMTEERGQQLVGLRARARAKQRTGPTPPTLDMHGIHSKHAAALRCALAPRRHGWRRCFVHFGKKKKKIVFVRAGGEPAFFAARTTPAVAAAPAARFPRLARPHSRRRYVCRTTGMRYPGNHPTTTNACHWASNPEKTKPAVQTEHRSGMDGWMDGGSSWENVVPGRDTLDNGPA